MNFQELQNKLIELTTANTTTTEMTLDKVENEAILKIKHLFQDANQPVYLRHCNFCNNKFDIGGVETVAIDSDAVFKPQYCCEQAETLYNPIILDMIKCVNNWKKQNYYKSMVDNSGIGERFKDKSFENYQIIPENKPFYDFCIQYCEKFSELKTQGKGLLLMGSCGTGKTHLAIAVMRKVAEHCKSLLFGSFVEIIQNLKNSFEKAGDKMTETAIIKQLTDVDLLVIDDLGKENVSNYVKMIAYQVINARYIACKTTIITTNDTSKELEAKYDPATVSRIFEICLVCAVKTSDYRKLINKQAQKDFIQGGVE